MADITIKGCVYSQSLADGVIYIAHLADEAKRADKARIVRSVVYEPGYSLGSPGESLKLLMPRIHPRTTGSGSVGLGFV